VKSRCEAEQVCRGAGVGGVKRGCEKEQCD